MYYISIKNVDGSYSHHSVDAETYIYVKQLEMYINNPKDSNLLEVYKGRFNNES
jgi:hypothetical protein